MGLRSLKSKIKEKLEQDTHSQESVLYTIAELYKYLERSCKDLGDLHDLKLDEKEYQSIKFFRNWALHPHRHNKDIPEIIENLLKKIHTDDNSQIEFELFELLKKDISNFYKKITVTKKKIEWESFFNSLKNILAEQPIKLSKDCWVGYRDDLLKLRKW